MQHSTRRRARLLALAVAGVLADTTYALSWAFGSLHAGAVTLYRAAGESWWRHEELDNFIVEYDVEWEDES